jgi:hypothetical protein
MNVTFSQANRKYCSFELVLFEHFVNNFEQVDFFFETAHFTILQTTDRSDILARIYVESL